VGFGRINVARITHHNVGPLCDAIAEVVKGQYEGFSGSGS
jgi:hypothetical protein